MNNERDRAQLDIAVPSEDPTERQEGDKSKEVVVKGKEVADGKDAGKDDEISEEDLQLKNELEMLVERLKESDADLYAPSLESLRTLIRTSTSSMTSVPKPLKFLRPFYSELENLRESWDESKLGEQKSLLSSILSVLAMTYSDNGNRDTLHYRIISKSKDAPGLWGHEYCRHLASEIGEEYGLIIAAISGEGSGTGADHAAATSESGAQVNGETLVATDNSSTKAIHTSSPTEPASAASAPAQPRPLKTKEELLALALELVPFFLSHNAEADAVDLLLELESIESIEQFLDASFVEESGASSKRDQEDRYRRVCVYMVSCVPLLVAPDDKAFLRTAASIYAKNQHYPQALALAVRLRDRKLIRKYFEAPTNVIMRKQLAFFLARAQIPIAWLHCSDPDSYVPPTDDTATADEMAEDTAPPALDEEILECLGNIKLSEHFKRFGKDLDLEKPRSLEDIYKSKGEEPRVGAGNDREILAGTFVNAFVNAGFGNDKLVVDVEDAQSYIWKNKDEGMMCATASLGMSMLWDSDVGVSQVDKYSYSPEEHIKAGALLATGILHAGVRAELDIAYALLEEHVDNKSVPLKVAAINGIALACAGSYRQDIADKLLPYVQDDTVSMEVSSMAALALGYVFVGSANGDIAVSIVQSLMEREEKALSEKWSRFMITSLGLLFLGKQDASEAVIELLKTIEHPLAKQAEIMVDVCSYAGTGNVLKVQAMLHHCADQKEAPKAEEEGAEAAAEGEAVAASAPANGAAPATGAAAAAPPAANGTTPAASKDTEKADAMEYQAFAVIGIALIAMGEEVGSEMCLRQFNHLMTYGGSHIRRAVPLALGLISASNPQLPILDSLSRYSHDNDLDVAANAILGMGLVGAGTNNARLAQMLRQLAVYYYKEPNCLFVVRIAQGLLHMGKGTIGINPFFHDRTIMSPVAVSGLVSLLVSFIDAKQFVLGKTHWMLYWLVTAMYPQFLITLDEELQDKAVTVRVGQAVNTVGLAGQRLGISGFQTHQTPVRIGTGERAEFGTNEYFPYASVLENLVIIKKNDAYEAEDAQ